MKLFHRKPKSIDPLIARLGEKIMYSISDIDDCTTRSVHENLPLLPNGQRNSSIPQDMLDQLPTHWKSRWPKLDLDKIFSDVEEETEIVKPIPPVKPINPLLKTIKKHPDLRTKLKAITFGEALPKKKEGV